MFFIYNIYQFIINSLGVKKTPKETNTIIVGPEESLIIQNLQLRDLNVLGPEKELDQLILIKVSSMGKLLKAKVNFKDKFEIIEGEALISPGQVCIFYFKDDYGDNLLGGGHINKTENKNLST